MLFPARLASTGEPHLPASAARLEVETRDGERLQGVHIAPARTSSGDRLVILGFGGNAWNAETLAVYLHELFPDMDAGAFHYRGYWPSTRLPSATVFGGEAVVSTLDTFSPKPSFSNGRSAATLDGAADMFASPAPVFTLVETDG